MSAATGNLARAWQGLRGAAHRATAPALEDEFHALFIGLGRGELVPYGSWYRTGFLMDVPLAQLRADLSRLGFSRQPQVREPEDNAAALCEVMALMIAGAEPSGRPQQLEFFTAHIRPWMPRLFRDMQTAASARFYVAVGALGEQFLELEQSYLQLEV